MKIINSNLKCTSNNISQCKTYAQAQCNINSKEYNLLHVI